MNERGEAQYGGFGGWFWLVQMPRVVGLSRWHFWGMSTRLV